MRDIVGKLAKELTGIFIEDWKDEMQEQYKDALEAFLSEINSASDSGSSNYKVQFTTPDGKKMRQCFMNMIRKMKARMHFSSAMQ